MKKTYFILILLLALVANGCKTNNENANEKDSPTIESTYFGQKPPGLISEIFAPGVISINGRSEHGI